MFESRLTGECGSFTYMLRNLIVRSYNGKIFLNLRWARYVLNDDDIWVREPYIKGIFKFIKEHLWTQVAFTLAAIGDTFIWLFLLGIL